MSTLERPWVRSYDSDMQPTIAEVPWRLLGDMITDSAARFGAMTAFRTVMPNGMSGAMSFAETAAKAMAFATWLRRDLGLAPGDRVALQAPNGLAYPVVAFGTMLAGLVLVNVNPLYTPDETIAVFKDAEPKVAVVIDLFADRLATVLKAAPVPHVVLASAAEFFPPLLRTLIGIVQRHVKKQLPAVTFAHQRLSGVVAFAARRGAPVSADYGAGLTPDSIACLQYTGGTTGVSKGAMLTHRNLIMNILQFQAFGKAGLMHGDVLLTALPLYHIFAFTVNLLNAFSRGCENILIPSPRPLINLKPAFDRCRPTYLTGVNTLFNGLMNEAWFAAAPPASLRKSVAGGMALQAAVAARWLKLTGTPVIEGYGLTEASPVISFNPFERPRAGSIGVPLPDTDIRIVDPEGRDVGIDEAGELLVRGPQVMAGYWRRPDETAKVMRNGWLATGDIAAIDNDGYLRIVDRLKDMIIVSGFNVFPNEIEDVLARLAGVRECAVIGVPDAEAGEAPKAFVVRSDPSLTVEAVRAHCRAHLTGYKVPKFVEFRDDLPKTNVGKILRKQLRLETP